VSVKANGVAQTSNVTVVNFTNDVNYVLTYTVDLGGYKYSYSTTYNVKIK